VILILSVVCFLSLKVPAQETLPPQPSATVEQPSSSSSSSAEPVKTSDTQSSSSSDSQPASTSSLQQQPAPGSTAKQPDAPGQSAGGTTSSASGTPASSASSSSVQEQETRKKEQSQRLFGVAPMFAVTSRQNAPPLTTGEKFHLFAKVSFDPFAYATAGFQAGLGQLQNEFPGYGQGAAGYGKRYGASLADQVSSNFFANFAYPALLKQDPRYFRLGEGPVGHRMLYSFAQEFTAHTDKGGRSFNWSNVLGAFSSGGLSNVYYPQTDRGFGLTISRSAISLGYGAIGGLADEFWPDIQRKLFHKH